MDIHIKFIFFFLLNTTKDKRNCSSIILFDYPFSAVIYRQIRGSMRHKRLCIIVGFSFGSEYCGFLLFFGRGGGLTIVMLDVSS